MSRCNNPRADRGFSLLEVMIATSILVVGLSAMAALGAVMLTRGRQARYISVAETLASEKLEDLNRYDLASQAICLPTGATSEGSLLSSQPSPGTGTATITCPGGAAAQVVSYYDMVSVDFVVGGDCGNAGNGCFAETIYNGNTSVYQTYYHSPDGVIPGGTTTNPGYPWQSSAAPGNTTFLRTWMIEANPPVGTSGLTTVSATRRVTVLVTLIDKSVKPPVSVQMSVVRQ